MIDNENVRTQDEKQPEGKRNHKLDIFALILCLIAAFTIWLFVVHSNQTVTEKTIMVTLNAEEQIANDTGMSLISGSDQIDYSKIKVELTVTGTKNALDKYKDSDYIVSLDTSDVVNAGRYSFSFNYKLPGDDVTFKSISPTYISTPVLVDTLSYREVSLTADYTDSGIAVGTEVKLSPKDKDKVTIKGPASRINTVERVVVNVNISGYNISTVIKSKIFEYFDANGAQVFDEYITVEPNEVEVNVVINYIGKAVQVTTNYNPPADLDVYKYDVEIAYADNKKAELCLTGDSALFTDALVYKLDDVSNITSVTAKVNDLITSGKIIIPSGLTVNAEDLDKTLVVNIIKTKIIPDEITNQNEPAATTLSGGGETEPIA